ncbi:MAG: winged helix-turn-helix transcriptional regulator [Candidatus Heimdallarchaeota archaeon]|nr:winged helix-turn-helix transcriptional regulator [Candidatus Heimdallarchaeota archaeon]
MKSVNFLIVIIVVSAISMIAIDSSSNPQESSLVVPLNESNNSLVQFSPKVIENETFLTHNMYVKLSLDNSIKVTSTYVLANNDSEPISFFVLEVNKTITSVYSFDPMGSLIFSWIIDPIIGNIINITLRYPLFPNDFCVFSTSYEIENVVYKVGSPSEFYALDYEVIHPRYSNRFNLEISLPVYALLLEEGPPDPVYPHPNKIYTEDEVVKINWYLTKRETTDDDIFLVRYLLTPQDTTNKPNLLILYYFLTLFAGIAIGIGGVLIYYTYRKKPAETELVSSLLTKTEQEVIKAINSDNGISTQRRICEKTGYSKSKVSQILAKLEEKNVLKRERWGRTNKVSISNPSFKNLGQDYVVEKPKEDY